VSPRGPTEEGGHLCYSFVCLGELLGLLSCEWGDLWVRDSAKGELFRVRGHRSSFYGWKPLRTTNWAWGRVIECSEWVQKGG
jgi:hypothetical protein